MAHSEPQQAVEGFVNAPLAEVWRIFTTSEGFLKTGAVQAQVDLRLGGAIRAHYDPKGQLGDPHTLVAQILAYEPERMLAMRITQAPADFPHPARVGELWTVLYFTASGEDMTHVRIVGLGYADDAESRTLRSFFERRDRATLDRIAKHYWPQCARCAAESAAAGSTTDDGH